MLVMNSLGKFMNLLILGERNSRDKLQYIFFYWGRDGYFHFMIDKIMTLDFVVFCLNLMSFHVIHQILKSNVLFFHYLVYLVKYLFDNFWLY